MSVTKIAEQPDVNLLKRTPRLWTFNYLLICLTSLTIYLAFYSLIPTLPVYIEQFGGTAGAAGLAMAVLTAAAVLGRPISGWALDKYGRRIIFLGGLMLFLLPLIIFYTWMMPVFLLIVFRFLQGLGWGMANTSAATVTADLVPPERLGEGMGFFSLTLSISMAIAPAASLWLIGNYSFQALFGICALLTIVAVFLALLIRYPQIERQSTAPPFVFMEKLALRPAMVILFVTLSYSALLSFLSLHALEKGLTTAGFFFTTFALTTLVSRPLSGIVVDRKGQKGYDLGVLIGSFLTIAAMPVLALTSTPLHLVAGGILYGTGFGFIQPAMLALCIGSVPPEKKGAANATYWTAFDIGIAGGSVIWGYVANVLGYSLMFNLTIIPALIALGIYFAKRSSRLSFMFETHARP